jgi:hypothetical protein
MWVKVGNLCENITKGCTWRQYVFMRIYHTLHIRVPETKDSQYVFTARKDVQR